MNLIHTKAASLEITPELMRRLHQLSQEGSGDAGQYKRLDNEVIELRPGAAPIVRFKCVSAKATPAAADELCRVYRHAIDQDRIAGDFTVAELERLCPGISRDHLRRSLKQMKADGLITCLGLGRGAKWRKQKEGRKPKRGS